MRNKIFTLAATLAFASGMSMAQYTSSSAQTSGASGDKTAKHSHAAKGDKTSNADMGGKMSKKDEMFMMKAAKGGTEEVELGKLAAEKAQNDQVKKFAERMVDDHGKANQELQSLAGQKGVTLPTAMDKEDQAEKDELSKLSGADFDKAYMRHMLKDHRQDVAEFQRNSKMAKDSDLKSWAEKTLPTLQDHLKEAQSTASAVGVNSASAMGGKRKSKAAKSTSGQ